MLEHPKVNPLVLLLLDVVSCCLVKLLVSCASTWTLLQTVFVDPAGALQYSAPVLCSFIVRFFMLPIQFFNHHQNEYHIIT